MPLPTRSPIKRPRILFWSRQNSKLRFGDLGLPGINASRGPSKLTISRQRPRPCVRPSQRCFPSFCQTSRIARGEYLEPFMVDLPLLEICSPSLDINEHQRNRRGGAAFQQPLAGENLFGMKSQPRQGRCYPSSVSLWRRERHRMVSSCSVVSRRLFGLVGFKQQKESNKTSNTKYE